MEREDCYNLFHHKDAFVAELAKEGFSLDDLEHVVEQESGNILGRILSSNPPYLVVRNPRPGDGAYSKGILSLTKLAKRFED